ncbi:general secretion pathway protein E [Pseudoduganella flava]|uniref:General secretion pathway protein E n=1 Tax=Pseudoduganella flava TaxID=871742 RepID=A0A562Q3H3_9BURK|nr:GspE/PulE family protein [Pseudoduganella flava]QGZ41351.1 type II/IV secretion system protein [Pseudoduganella flava]TWI51297.1 general secretion pathway protein E [Pseudoduganella flava]
MKDENNVALVMTPEHILNARIAAHTHGGGAVAFLEEALSVSPGQFIRALGEAVKMPVLELAGMSELTPLFDVLSLQESMQRNCLVASDGARVCCVLADPFDLALQAWLQERIDSPISWHVAHRSDLDAFFAVHEQTLRVLDDALHTTPEEGALEAKIEEISLATIAEDSSPVIRLVNSTIYDALKVGASDIHLEATGTGLHVKYRIDGVLASIAQIPGNPVAEQIISRIKVMAELDIGERRVPQDGRFKLSVRGHEIDYRVSVMPSLLSEDVVIRVLDKRQLASQAAGLRLQSLGFGDPLLAQIRALSRKPYGMFLVTGPTGSGKTTTMYAALSEINNGQDKIVTIEDPVEYQLPGVLQIPVNEKKGLTFARGLRSILRHDPDKILVGEIRDAETAQIAVQSALTGHLVFTSVHANNVFDVLGRFQHMGVDTYNFVSALNGILAQRLVRVVCPDCAAPHVPTEEELAFSGLAKESLEHMQLVHGVGCRHCRGTGYKGRYAIGEVLNLNDDLREMIANRAPARSIKAAAQSKGTRFLRDAALDLVAQGKTTLEEINRVTFVA